MNVGTRCLETFLLDSYTCSYRSNKRRRRNWLLPQMMHWEFEEYMTKAILIICSFNNVHLSLVLSKPRLTLKVAGDVVLDLVVAWRAEEQSPVHQRKLFKHGQRSVAQRTVHQVPPARAQRRQDEPAGRHGRRQHDVRWQRDVIFCLLLSQLCL